MAVKFKPKTKKGAKKRLIVTNPKNPAKTKLLAVRINHRHRLINKSGERKLKASRKTTLSKITDKFKQYI